MPNPLDTATLQFDTPNTSQNDGSADSPNPPVPDIADVLREAHARDTDELAALPGWTAQLRELLFFRYRVTMSQHIDAASDPLACALNEALFLMNRRVPELERRLALQRGLGDPPRDAAMDDAVDDEPARAE